MLRPQCKGAFFTADGSRSCFLGAAAEALGYSDPNPFMMSYIRATTQSLIINLNDASYPRGMSREQIADELVRRGLDVDIPTYSEWQESIRETESASSPRATAEDCSKTGANMSFLNAVLHDLEKIPTFIESIPGDIEKFFTSPAVENAESTLVNLITEAMPIIKEIAAAVPNKTIQEVTALYEKYGVPLASTLEGGASAIENAMLNLATILLAKSQSAANSSTSLLQTAIQIALTLFKLAITAA